MSALIPHFGIILLAFLASATVGSTRAGADATLVAIIVGLLVMLIYTGFVGLLTGAASFLLFAGMRRM